MSEIDLLTVGRVNLDLYSQQVGVPFEDVAGWDAMVGGSPTNVAIAATRLGVRAGVFTAVGDDLAGDWVLRALEQQGVETAFTMRKSGPHTSLALLAQLPPDYPLSFYRHDPADVHLTIREAAGLPLADVRLILVSADALARGSTAETCDWIFQRAHELEKIVYLDLDLRQVNWSDLDAYAAAVAPQVARTSVVLGTIEEFAALLGLSGSMPDEQEVLEAVRVRLADDPTRLLIVKQGRSGATFQQGRRSFRVPATTVDEVCSVGAGDSFAAGLIDARLRGADWREAACLASACAAITVSRSGCSSGFPYAQELEREVVQEQLVHGRR